MDQTITKIEKRIADLFGFEYCLLVGSGTTALYLILKSLELKNKKILVPAISCPYPSYAVFLSGNTPIYSDVSLSNACITLQDIKSSLNEHQNISGVIGIHLFGNLISGFSAILKFLKEKSIPYIDDLAQGVGLPFYSEEWIPSDMGIVSFGVSKILDAGHGGAVLCNDIARYKAIRQLFESNVAPFTKNIYNVQADIVSCYYQILDNKYLSSTEKKNQIVNLVKENKRAYVFRYNDVHAMVLSKKLDNIKDILSIRVETANYYNEILKKYDADIICDHDAVPWKYSILHGFDSYDDNLKKVLDMRGLGYQVSNNYPDLGKILSCDNSGTIRPNAQIITRDIINFPMNYRNIEIKKVIEHFYKGN